MSRKHKYKSLASELMEFEEFRQLRELIKKEDKKEEKKDDKKPKLNTLQLTLLGMLLFPFSGPIVVGLWKLSGTLIQQLVK